MAAREEERAAARRAAAHLQSARRALFITGAGISADSGLPTYRGVGGLYGDVDTEEGVPIEEVVSGRYFRRHPEVTWKYLHQMEQAARGRSHNAAHRFIAELEASLESVVVLTQNVDGFHEDAGSSVVIALHGDIRRLRCTACEWSDRVSSYQGLAPLPRCPDCDAIIRPDVVLFGEMLPMHEVARMQAELSRGFDVVFSVGTTALFPYIAAPVVEAAAAGVLTVEINPDRTILSDAVRERLPMRAVEAFELIRELLGGAR